MDWSDSISKGLVGCWLFNEGGGYFAYDIAGKNKGTLTNMAFPSTATSGWGVGKFGKALNFDGTNDYVALPSAFFNTAHRSVSIRFKIFTLHTGMVFSGGTGNPNRWYMTPQVGGTINMRVGGGAEFSIGASYVLGAEHHMVATYDAVNVHTYLDGVQRNSQANSTLSGSANVNIGSFNNGVSNFFNGIVYGVSIYNRALSAGEVKRLYSEPFAGILTPVRRMVNTVAASGSLIKTINGLARSSVSGYNGLALASIKTINGLSNQ